MSGYWKIVLLRVGDLITLKNNLRDNKSTIIKSTLIVFILTLFGCVNNQLPENKFIKWNDLKKLAEQNINTHSQILLQGFIADKIIRHICQLSPYTHRLANEYDDFFHGLAKSGVLPISEYQYVFAYFGKEKQLIGYDYFHANKGSFRPSAIPERDYVCVSIDTGKLQISKHEQHIGFWLSSLNKSLESN